MFTFQVATAASAGRGRFVYMAVTLAAVVAVTAVSVPRARGSHSTTAARPDLAMLPPSDFSIERRPKGGRWLRFDTVVVNKGPGPFDVFGYRLASDETGPLAVVQRLAETDSTWSPHGTPAKMTYAGDGHNHWHVMGLQQWTLTNENASVLRRGAKTGFCFWDNYRYGSAHDVYYHWNTTSACLSTTSDDYVPPPDANNRNYVPMGLSVGWGDKYESNLAFQYIDITGLGYGDYLLTLTADPAQEFIETDDNVLPADSNNTSWARINIGRKGVRILSQSPSP